ncbi:putative peptidase [Bacillus sp. TS-2]|nr:putative peptidase [Bacillus sp. TS-2]
MSTQQSQKQVESLENPSLFSKIKSKKVLFLTLIAVFITVAIIGITTYHTNANQWTKEAIDHSTAEIDISNKPVDQPAFVYEEEEYTENNEEEKDAEEREKDTEEPSNNDSEENQENEIIELDSTVENPDSESTEEKDENEQQNSQDEENSEEVIEEENEEKDESEENSEIDEESANQLVNQLKEKVYTIYSTNHQGSGFLYNSNGIVITNAHVVTGDLFVTVKTQSGSEHVAEVIGYSNETDIAVLLVNDFDGQSPAPIDKGSQAAIGDQVLTLGTPQGASFTSTTGNITETGLSFSINNFLYLNLYESSAPTQPGNSGGPLVSISSGKIIGINSAMDKNRESISYSIPVFAVESLIQDWVQSPLSQDDLLAIYGDQAVAVEDGNEESLVSEEEEKESESLGTGNNQNKPIEKKENPPIEIKKAEKQEIIIETEDAIDEVNVESDEKEKENQKEDVSSINKINDEVDEVDDTEIEENIDEEDDLAVAS